MASDHKNLKRRLDRLYQTFDPAFLSTDPLEFLHRYDSPEDREVVGLVASSLAYGRVATIRKSIEWVLEKAGPSPRRFAETFTARKGLRAFEGFKHRFNDGRDVACLFLFARRMIEEGGSIGAFFEQGLSPEDATVRRAVESFSERVLSIGASSVYGTEELPAGAGVRFFFPSPSGGSGCKRLNLYLRWMVRGPDGLDFGLWPGVGPERLVIPLDTHIARISGNIGLTTKKTPSWAMAEDITATLRELDPRDPVRYDFALCRLGILDECPARVDRRKCEKCLMKELCVL